LQVQTNPAAEACQEDNSRQNKEVEHTKTAEEKEYWKGERK
jgi:hypothetical protein